MSNQDSLKEALREALDANGTITHVKAELRAAIFKSLSSTDGRNREDTQDARPPEPPDNLVINELIKEYLAFNGLEHTLAVFQLEGRVQDNTVPRKVLSTELNLPGASDSIPLLYSMIHEARLSRDILPV